MCKVSIPRMVEWRDEYTRKSGHTPDKVAQSRADQNRKDQRESKDEVTLSDCLAAEAQGRRAPPDFDVTNVLQEWAVTNCPSVPIEKETAKFKRWEFSTPRNDWDAQWRLWIQRADEHQGATGTETAASSDTQDMLELGALLELEKNPDESTIEYCNRVKDVNQRRLNTLDG